MIQKPASMIAEIHKIEEQRHYQKNLIVLCDIAQIPPENVLSWWAVQDYDEYVLYGITGYEVARVTGIQIHEYMRSSVM